MNPFPVIFARDKDVSELTHIRISFASKPVNPFLALPLSWAEFALKSSPKPVRLKRPGTTRHLSCPKAGDFTQKLPLDDHPKTTTSNPHTKSRSISTAPTVKMSRKLRRLMKAAAQPPIVLGREVGKRVERIRAGSSPVAQGDIILNLETEPCEVSKSPRVSKRRKLVISRSKSVQGRREIRMASNDLDTGRDVHPSVVSSQRAPLLPPQSRADSPLLQRTERASTLLDFEEGCATLPVGLTRIHYLERAFGPQIKSAEKRVLITKFLIETLGVKISQSANVRISQQVETSELSVLITGPQSPLSKCCRSALVFSFSKAQGGKLLCTAACCPSRTLSNFHLSVSLRDQLWPAVEMPTDSAAMSSFELSTHIRRGSYKVISLRREMERRGKTQGKGDGSAQGIFTNEKLKHVSPTPKQTGMRLPVFQTNALTPYRHKATVGRTPLQSIFHRTNSRHNTIQKCQTPTELLEQLSSLLQPV